MTGRRLIAVLLTILSLGLVAWAASFATAVVFALGLAIGGGVFWLSTRGGGTVTARREAFRKRDRDLKVPSVLDAAPNPCVLLDARSNVVHANTASRAAFPALRQGQPLSFALRDPALLQAVNGCLLTGAAQATELVERLPIERSFACSVQPVEGRKGAALLVMRNTSQERAVEAMRVDFVANASHELRTPLASILGFIETLQGPAKEDAGARAQFLGIMADQARRMARLVDDLLSLSRIEMKQHVVPDEVVNLTDLVGQAVKSLTRLAQDRGVELALDVPERPVHVLGDQDELLSVFDNLIENGIKYGKSGKKVEIALSAADEAMVRVRDYGPGIPSEHVPRLTERFYRVDSAHSRSEGGTGLGLALVKHTLRRHRGQLAIVSRPGDGATFTVSLPLARQA